MCSAGQLNVKTGTRQGAGPDDSRQPAVSGTDCGAGDTMCVGVILGFPPEIARELQEWRASFGDPMAEVIPAHITLITTTPTQDCRHPGARQGSRKDPGTFRNHHFRHGFFPSRLAGGVRQRGGRL